MRGGKRSDIGCNGASNRISVWKLLIMIQLGRADNRCNGIIG